MTQNRRLLYNTLTSLSYQLVTILCGFILPRMILSHFGSDVNGLISSVVQFLGFISLMQMGVGAVVESSLYKPLAEDNWEDVSAILKSARKFFHTIACVLACYVAVLCLIYPRISKNEFGWLYTASLILIISIGTFAQYAFGIVDRLLLLSDQRGYIVYLTQILATVLNTVICAVAIVLGGSIHLVKLLSVLVLLLSPIMVHIYIRRHYAINYRIQYEGEPIKQKWNGIAQHVAAVVLDGTDIVVLTAFSTLSNVSIYSVYNLVVKGVTTLTIALTNGIQALLGELWAKKETEKLKSMFSWTEWLIHTGTVFIFGCTAVLIVPFVKVYTKGISDADYMVPLFGILLTLANAGHCLRLPYNLMILAGGHYKQTQRCYIIAAGLNLGISILAVKQFGLIGVAVGTLLAMIYQTVWMAGYVSKNLICWPIRRFIKQISVDIITFAAAGFLTIRIPMHGCNFGSWMILAVIDAFVWLLIVFIVNAAFYPKHIRQTVGRMKPRRK